jgi:hypothetical protein
MSVTINNTVVSISSLPQIPNVIHDDFGEFERSRYVGYDRQIVTQLRENFFLFQYAESFKSKDDLLNKDLFSCYIKKINDCIQVTKSTLPCELSNMLLEGILVFFEDYYSDKNEQIPTRIVQVPMYIWLPFQSSGTLKELKKFFKSLKMEVHDIYRCREWYYICLLNKNRFSIENLEYLLKLKFEGKYKGRLTSSIDFKDMSLPGGWYKKNESFSEFSDWS